MSADRLMVVRLVDDRQRTVCVFKWVEFTVEQWREAFPDGAPPEPHWMVAPKPPSQRSLDRAKAESERTGRPMQQFLEDHKPQYARQNRHNYKAADGKVRRSNEALDVPGLSLRWDKVTAVLDKLTEALPGQDFITLTVAQFRHYAGKIQAG